MKALITKVEYKGEKKNEKFGGVLHDFVIHYDDKRAFYSSKKQDQTTFIEGQECEFEELELTSKKGTKYLKVKPIYAGAPRSFQGKEKQRFQVRYSSFAMSYAKDLVVADRIPIAQMPNYTKSMFKLMVELDKSLDNGNS